jgi:hypothetical protein
MSDKRDLRLRWNTLMKAPCPHHGSAVTYCESCHWHALAALCADARGTAWDALDDETRCAVCARPLDQGREGCVRGDCSVRPLPSRFYALPRVCLEYQRIVVDTGTEHRFYDE